MFNIKIAAQKFTNFDTFFMHTDMTAVTIQSNKILLKVKKTKHYYSHRTEELDNFLANPILLPHHVILKGK